MMAKDRANRYAKPEDLILDLRCLIAGERPMVAQQKAEDLASLDEAADEDVGDVYRPSSVTEDEKGRDGPPP